MWRREEAAKPVKPAPTTPITGVGAGGSRAAGPAVDRDVVNIGKSVLIKGDLSGSEDLTIEGRVEGKIELPDHVLTIGPHGRIKAQVFAKVVVVLGEVVGNIEGSDKVSICDNGVVEGDILAPRVAIAEGAKFRGRIDMRQGAGPKGEDKPAPQQRAASPKGEEKPGAKRPGHTPVQPQAKTAANAPIPALAGRTSPAGPDTSRRGRAPAFSGSAYRPAQKRPHAWWARSG